MHLLLSLYLFFLYRALFLHFISGILEKSLLCFIANKKNVYKQTQMLDKDMELNRKHHSTSTCILTVLITIYRNIEMNKVTGMIFLNPKKTFGTVTLSTTKYYRASYTNIM